MTCLVRLMRHEDIAQVIEIDREAFPTQWPAPNYHHELQNRLSHYIVAYREKTTAESETGASPGKRYTWLLSQIRRRLGLSDIKPPPSTRDYILGFAGLWIMADEAHITNIAVRTALRYQGIGELLLISLIDLAAELKARIVTLEVRVSNLAAQRLYSKYGFTEVGIRRGYYTDNREDATLMSTENITSALFQAQLSRLKQAHSRKWR